MAKEKNNVEVSAEELTPKQQKIKELTEQLKAVKEEGSFGQFYSSVRKGTVTVNKLDVEEDEKKLKLYDFMKSEIEKLESHLRDEKLIKE